ncbi:MAG: radical SAM protein [Lachnospiraceae bacterium]|nr:radical SAM protein [Lachnospiraceae bacterium]
MLKTVIYGNIIISEIVKEFIEKKYNKEALAAGGEEMAVEYFAGDILRGQEPSVPLLSGSELLQKLHNNDIQILIVPKECAMGGFSLPWTLFSNGISLENLYFADRLSKMETTDSIEILDYFTPFFETKYLGYLEFHVADHCNLNCKACEHYSGLVKEEVYPDYDKFEKDFTKFHNLIDDIGVLRILGGEPLMNKDINKYMKLARSLYPDARIYVVTNGVLLKAMPEEFYKVMAEENIVLSISFYPPMKDTMPEVLKLLDEKKVNYTLTPLNTEFGKKQILEPQSDDETIMAFYKCSQKMCNNFYDGKVAACFLPFTTKYFNEYFDKDLPEDGAIDIYELGMNTRRLKERLLYPFLRCRYCSTETEMIPWDVMHNPSVLEDWIKA